MKNYEKNNQNKQKCKKYNNMKMRKFKSYKKPLNKWKMYY